VVFIQRSLTLGVAGNWGLGIGSRIGAGGRGVDQNAGGLDLKEIRLRATHENDGGPLLFTSKETAKPPQIPPAGEWDFKVLLGDHRSHQGARLLAQRLQLPWPALGPHAFVGNRVHRVHG